MANNSLQELYRRHRQGLYSLALTVTHRADLAEDAVHSAFVKLCRLSSRSWFDPDDPKAAAYAYQTVRTCAIDICRKTGRNPQQNVGDKQSIFDTAAASHRSAALPPDQALLESERDELIAQALEGLPDVKRQVVVMKLYGGLTFEQISQVLDEPRDTVASRYRRALEQIKRALEALV